MNIKRSLLIVFTVLITQLDVYAEDPIEEIVVTGKAISKEEVLKCYDKFENNNFGSPGEAAYCKQIMPARDSNEDLEYRLLGTSVEGEDTDVSLSSTGQQRATRAVEANAKADDKQIATSTPADSSISPIVEHDLNLPSYPGSACEQATTAADRCCGQPESCLITSTGYASDAIAGQLLSLLAPAQTKNSINQMCSRIKNVGQAMVAVNGYLAARCQEKITQCRSACRPSADRIRRELSTASPEEKRTLNARYSDYLQADARCESSNNATWKLAQQAAANQLGSQLAQACEQEVATTTSPVGNNQTQMANMPPVNPTGISVPTAAAEQARQPLPQNPRNNSNPFDLDRDNEGPQTAQPTDTLPRAQKSAGTNGTVNSQVALAGPNSTSANTKNSTNSTGYNTQIDRGLASGNGYSYNNSYTQPLPTYNPSERKPFGFRDYIPTTPSLAERQLTSAPNEIHPPTADLFKKISARIYQICLHDGLYDCATLLRAKATAGN